MINVIDTSRLLIGYQENWPDYQNPFESPMVLEPFDIDNAGPRHLVMLQQPGEQPKLATIIEDRGCTGENHARQFGVTIQGMSQIQVVNAKDLREFNAEMTLAMIIWRNFEMVADVALRKERSPRLIGMFGADWNQIGIGFKISRWSEYAFTVHSYVGEFQDATLTVGLNEDIEFAFETESISIQRMMWFLSASEILLDEAIKGSNEVKEGKEESAYRYGFSNERNLTPTEIEKAAAKGLDWKPQEVVSGKDRLPW